MIRPTTCRIPGGNPRATALLIASMLLCAPLCAQTSKTESEAKITSAGPIGTEASQNFVIRGVHFGTYKPYNGCEPFLRITNLRNNQAFGQSDSTGLCEAILVTSWADTEIVVEGFPPFEPRRNVFNIGDVIKIEVANPQQRGWVSSGDNFNHSQRCNYTGGGISPHSHDRRGGLFQESGRRHFSRYFGNGFERQRHSGCSKGRRRLRPACASKGSRPLCREFRVAAGIDAHRD
jgi:hypothetical protein